MRGRGITPIREAVGAFPRSMLTIHRKTPYAPVANQQEMANSMAIEITSRSNAGTG